MKVMVVGGTKEMRETAAEHLVSSGHLPLVQPEYAESWVHAVDVVVALPEVFQEVAISVAARKLGKPYFFKPEPHVGSDLVAVELFLRAVEAGKLSPVASTSLESLQSDVYEWLQKQPFYSNQEPWEPLVGMAEELGELSRAHLKAHQGIRGTKEQHDAAAKDAIGDILIYMMGYCIQRGWSAAGCVRMAADEVFKRDWAQNPENGKVEP